LESISKYFGNHPVAAVLLLAGLLGFIFGITLCSWQDSVETAQVLAGVVKYPPANPYYMYHLKGFALINHISAVLLYVLGSEKMVSIIVSGLMGMLSFQALSMIIFAVCRRPLLSVLWMVFIYLLHYEGAGVVYCVDIVGKSGMTFGIIGLGFIVLTAGLLGVGIYRWGFFCLGLAPCVHPAFGTWAVLVVGIALLCQRNYFAQAKKTALGYFLAGMGVSVALLCYHLYLIRDFPDASKEYFDSFVKYWGFHRRKFFWDYSAGQYDFLNKGTASLLYSIIITASALMYFKREKPIAFMFRVILLSGIFSLVLALVTHIPPQYIPGYVSVLMPGRFVNFSNITVAPCVLGILSCADFKNHKTAQAIFLILLASSLIAAFTSFTPLVQIFCFALFLLWFCLLAAKKYFRNQTSTIIKPERYAISFEKWLLIFLIIFTLVNIPRKRFVKEYLYSPANFADRTNDSFYQKVAQRKGLLATMGGYGGRITLKTRRPVLINMAAINFFTHVPESGEILHNILKKVYGIDLLVRPAEKYRHKDVPAVLYKDLWQSRSSRQWQKIRKEFAVTDVLTDKDWMLSLEKVCENNELILYTIPD